MAMLIRDVKLAVLDTSVVADLATRDVARRQAVTLRLEALHREGMLTAITGTVLTEIVASSPKRRKQLVDALTTLVDVFLPFEARDLVEMELGETDPAGWLGGQTLHGTGRLSEVLAQVDEPDVEAYNRRNREQAARIKLLAPQADPDIRQLRELEDFASYVARCELVDVRTFLESVNASGWLGDVDVSPMGLRAVLERGKAIRMGVLMSEAYHYHRAKIWVEQRQTTRPSGALSDAPILGAAAYAHVALTADREFVAAGQLVNDAGSGNSGRAIPEILARLSAS